MLFLLRRRYYHLLGTARCNAANSGFAVLFSPTLRRWLVCCKGDYAFVLWWMNFKSWSGVFLSPTYTHNLLIMPYTVVQQEFFLATVGGLEYALCEPRRAAPTPNKPGLWQSWANSYTYFCPVQKLLPAGWGPLKYLVVCVPDEFKKRSENVGLSFKILAYATAYLHTQWCHWVRWDYWCE